MKTGRVIGGTIWSAAQIIATQFLGAAVFFVLGRLVPPAAFGTVALCQSCVLILQAIAGLGLVQIYIQAPELDQRAKSTLFFLGFLSSVTLFIAFSAASAIYIKISQADVPVILPIVLGITLPISSLYAIHQAALVRKFDFRALAIRSIVAQIIGGGTGIAFAIRGAGPWSIVAYRIVVVAVECITIWLQSRWIPIFCFNPTFAYASLRNGLHVVGVQLLSMAEPRLMEFTIASALGTSALALYVMGARIVDICVQIAIKPFHSVILPQVASLGANKAAIAAFYGSASKWMSWLTIGGLGFLAVYSNDVVRFVLGEKWTGVAPLLRIFSANCFVYSLFYLYEPTLLGLGAFKQLFRLRIAQAILGVSGGCLGLLAGGLPGAAAGQVCAMLLSGTVAAFTLKREAGLDIPRLLLGVIAPAGSTAIALLATRLYSPPAEPFLVLLRAGSAYVVTFALCFAFLERKTLRIETWIVNPARALARITVDRSQPPYEK